MSSARAKAEEQFARLTRPRKENASVQERPPLDEKTARLRALRLAKEEAEREAAAAAAKPARKKSPA